MIDLSSFDVIEYLQEAGISYSSSGKNVSENWIGLSCPFCGDSSNHCGINIHTKAFSCFRCGEKGRVTKLIMALENKDPAGAMNTVKKFLKKEKYGSNSKRIKQTSNAVVDELIRNVTTPLCERDGDYLISRGFDPYTLGNDYGILSCKPGSDYCQRILIPYNVMGKSLTFSTRDVSGLAEVKYLHCPASKSILPPKELLFGIDHCTKDTCVVVEGVFDVFRIGKGSVATSGTQYTRTQLLALSQFKRIFLLFDPEPKAQVMALLLAKDLGFCSSEVEIIKLDVGVDPGDMKEDDVKVLRKEVFGKIY
jgi:DNA primase